MAQILLCFGEIQLANPNSRAAPPGYYIRFWQPFSFVATPPSVGPKDYAIYSFRSPIDRWVIKRSHVRFNNYLSPLHKPKKH